MGTVWIHSFFFVHWCYVGEVGDMFTRSSADPPAPMCRDIDQGIYVGEWMVPRCYGIDDSEKGLHITNKTRKFSCVFEVVEKTRGVSKRAHSYFLYV